MDWQVAHSPLVVVARIDQVNAVPLSAEEAPRYANLPVRPTHAIVTPIQVLKGTLSPQTKSLEVASGPIFSCAPFPVHVTFHTGDTVIFVFSAKRGDAPSAAAEYEMTYAGGMLPLDQLAQVTDALERCKQWRAQFLVGLDIGTLTAARKLDGALNDARSHWPPLPDLTGPTSRPSSLMTDDALPLSPAAQEVFNRVDKMDITTLLAALALDFTRADGWSKHPLWNNVAQRYCLVHSKETADFLQATWTRELRNAGVAQDQIDKYLARMQGQSDNIPLSFPIPSPASLTHLIGENLTTDFILRSHEFDRGGMYFVYGATNAGGVVSAGTDFGTLEAARLGLVIPAMYCGQNENLHAIAAQAIAEMHDDRYVPLVADAIAAGKLDAWYPLLSPRELADQHFRALAAAGTQESTSFKPITFWSQMTKAECFENSCIAAAIESLQRAEADRSDDAEDMRFVLRNYLDAARAKRAPVVHAVTSAKEYRIFFDKNPVAPFP
ncbi:MAG TPA: hypothetical protein VM008_05820 [Phycisphaerae bacterium]|nr:hypothetical protein [Phycisphaerae bacterium]